MNGLLLVDKPYGVTSFDVVRKVRRWCGTRQVGHCGTLDPLATGVLPVAVGSATRLVEYLMEGDKEYVATLRLGAVTDTQDGDGKVLETHPWDHIDVQTLKTAIAGFVGIIHQVPPMHSALKRGGVPLYRLARQGVEVEREAREVRIEAIDVLDAALPDVSLRVVCSKGTYIRTLCHDLGRQLGCGGYMAALCRTRCGSFRLEDCHSLEALEELAGQGVALPMMAPAAALPELPAFQVHAEARARLGNGIAPTLDEVAGSGEVATGTTVRLLIDARLAAIARYAPGGEGGRPGDFVLTKVFPESILFT